MKNIYLMQVGIFLMALLSINFASAQITTYDYTGAIETYTVPAGVTSISIQVLGAQGGNDNGGLGASMYGVFSVTPGQLLNLAVGQQGIVNNCGGADASGGGGGGSFVWDPTDDALPMIAAGGGGGGNENWGGLVCREGIDGQATEDGASGAEGMAAGGVGGMGGAGDAPSGTGSGGGGWLSAGQNSTWGDGCTGGTTLPTFTGGNGASGFGPGGEGGFGGGGGAVCGCGGGGGYSGGAGGNGSSCRAGGGGGGSYNDGTDQVNEAGVRSGNGQIVITVLCSLLDVTVTDDVICLGESFTLDASGLGTISWDGGIENGVPFTPATAGVFTYTASSDDGGDCGYSLDIEVFALPEVVATADDAEICDGDGLTLNGTGADSYAWDMGVVDGVAFTPDAGTHVYTVIGTDTGTGCQNSDEIEIIVYELPVIEALATDNEICLGESITLYGAGGETYVWMPAGTIDDEEFAPDATGTTTYEVTGTDGNGCVNTASTEVTVYDAITITYTTVDEMMGADGAINITVTGGNPAYSFDWDNDGTGDFDDTEDLADLVGGTYIVVVEDEAGCIATETIVVNSQLSVHEVDNSTVVVYPNPTSNSINVQLVGPFDYQLLTVNGDFVLNGSAVNQKTINLDELAAGVYFIEVKSEKVDSRVKVIKQ